ncbi:MAG: isocitrate lyase/PEP mutase family protein [Bacteroidota bacterium]
MISFQELHLQSAPLLLGNVWNVQSARTLEKLKFKAVGTSSAAVAETLGYKDGEQMPFEEYFMIIRRIREAVSIPLSVDLEAGYGKTTNEIVGNIKRLHALGVAGINIEDSVVRNGVREIVIASDFAKKLEAITSQLKAQDIKLFINVRCDAFLLGLPNARKEAIERMAAYEKAEIHGFFLPCITDVEDIKAVVKSTGLPVNVMCMPGLPDFDVLQSLNVKRISMGNFVNGAVYKMMENISRSIVENKSFAGLFK